MWGCLCSDMQKPPNMRASSNISFLCLVRPFSWHIWGLRNVLRTKIHTTYPWKIQLLGLWCSKVFFSFLHPNQCGLIQGFQLGLDRLWSNCATWLFKFLCCKLENVNRFWLWISFWGGVVCSFFWGNNADLGFILFYFHFQRSFGTKCWFILLTSLMQWQPCHSTLPILQQTGGKSPTFL